MEIKETKTKAICILGMHRSGTSVVARAVNLLGAYLGEQEDLLEPNVDNPEGYWEHKDIVTLHDRVLDRLKKIWHTPSPLGDKWHLSEDVGPFKDELAGIIRTRFAGRGLWAWKDPRTSLLLPLWKDVLGGLGCDLSAIIVVRNPIDVARSLHKREAFPYDKSFAVWFNYNISLLRATDGMPRTFVLYDKLIKDWECELKRCAEALDIPWPADAALSELREKMNSFIQPGFRHSVSSHGDLNAHETPAPVVELFDLMSKAADVLISKQDMSLRIEALSKEFFLYARFFEYDITQLWFRDALLKEDIWKIAVKDRFIAERDALLKEDIWKIAVKDRFIAERDAQLINKERFIAEMDRELSDCNGRINDILTSYSWRITAPMRALLGFFNRSASPAQGALPHAGSQPSDEGRHMAAGTAVTEKQIKAQELFEAYNGRPPKFSIISVLYNKENEIVHYLNSFFDQRYPGDVEIILVNDCSGDDTVGVIERYLNGAAVMGRVSMPDVRIIRNEKNVGNCVSRNTGIAHASGDIVVVIDADCVVNRDFLANHAAAHSIGDCDVVIGPFNLETLGKEPAGVLEAYESDLEKVMADSQLQDTINLSSFLNCITRNFSIKRGFITEELFDPLFSYSKAPDAGFGWEDIEMGYRLYKRGGRIKFVKEAFSIHVSHHSSVDERTKPLKSLLNYRRLFGKHPELLFAARRWALDTYRKICAWADGNDLPVNDDRMFLDNLFQRFLPPPFYIKTERKLRILSYRWHCPHQYEIYKLPYDFILATGVGTGFTNAWEYEQRPLRPNAVFRPIDKINPKDFDLAIAHFDENVFGWESTNGVIPEEWGVNFRWFIENVKKPMVAICHGTPQFHGQYTLDYQGPDLMKVIEKTRQSLVEFLGGVTVVCNSHQAEREWGFKRSKVIWHGFDPTEYPPAHYTRGVLSLGKPMKERPYYRGYYLFNEVFKKIPEKYAAEALLVPKPHGSYQNDTNAYAFAKYRNYVDNIRRYSIYFNPTLRSPMPRSRGEAMMCGLVTVSANNHDVELFIKNGVNGFYSSDAAELREYLLYLLENPNMARKIGMKGRLLAMDVFNHDRYLKAWDDLISELLGTSHRN